MKYLLTAALFFTALFGSAQIVNIPDPVLKGILVGNPGVNTNGDSEIQQSEAAAVQTLYFGASVGSQYQISDMTGIEAFTNLETLECGYCNLTTLGNILQVTSLRSLICSNNSLTSLAGIQSLVNLRVLICNYNNNEITGLNVSGMLYLNTVMFNNNSISTINLAGCDSLGSLHLENSKLSYFDITPCPNLYDCSFSSLIPVTAFIAEGSPQLKYLQLGGNIANVNCKNCDSLASLHLDESFIKKIDISGSGIAVAYISATSIDSCIARGCAHMTGFVSNDGNTIKKLLDLTGCANLQLVDIVMDSLSSLDLSSCVSLQLLSITGTHLKNKYFNLKNGSFANVQISDMSGQVDSLNFCVDDFEIDTLTTIFSQALLPGYTINLSSYCSFFPGGNYNTIKGKAKIDLDNNGCDNNDQILNGLPIRFTDASGTTSIRYTFVNGGYDFYTYAGNYTVQPYFPYPYFNISPATSNVNFAIANNLVDSINFCVEPNGVHNDVGITFIPTWAPARPGMAAGYQIVYKNRGTTTLSGDVQLNFQNSKMNFNSASTAVSSQTTGQLSWHYNNLLPFERRNINVVFDLLPVPINNIGDTLVFLATISPVINDETPNDNSFIFPQAVRAAYDPNDKICLEGEKLNINNIGKPLDYMIHFQNLGNDTAFNIVVTDQLSDKYDWNSVEITGTSHPFELREKDGKLEFIFENIKLPYAAINEPASHGFVAFKVKPVSSLVIGDSLNNKAKIYFDFNLPVVTNLASTIVNPTSTVPVKLEYFSLVNKNEANQLVWKASSTTGITDFAIERSNDGIHFSNIGNITASMERCLSPFNFTDEKPFDGKTYYRLNIKDANGISFYSKVLVAERTRSGLSIITAVVSSQNNTTVYLNALNEQNIQIKVIAADGRLVYNQTKTIAAGSSTMNLSMKNLSTGIYTLVVYTNEGEVITKRFVK